MGVFATFAGRRGGTLSSSRPSRCKQPLVRLLLTRWCTIAARNSDVPEAFWKILLYTDTTLREIIPALLIKIVMFMQPTEMLFQVSQPYSNVIESYHDSPSQVHKYIVSPKSMTQHIKQKVCCIMRHYGSEVSWQELKWTLDQLRPAQMDWFKACMIQFSSLIYARSKWHWSARRIWCWPKRRTGYQDLSAWYHQSNKCVKNKCEKDLVNIYFNRQMLYDVIQITSFSRIKTKKLRTWYYMLERKENTASHVAIFNSSLELMHMKKKRWSCTATFASLCKTLNVWGIWHIFWRWLTARPLIYAQLTSTSLTTIPNRMELNSMRFRT